MYRYFIDLWRFRLNLFPLKYHICYHHMLDLLASVIICLISKALGQALGRQCLPAGLPISSRFVGRGNKLPRGSLLRGRRCPSGNSPDNSCYRIDEKSYLRPWADLARDCFILNRLNLFCLWMLDLALRPCRTLQGRPHAAQVDQETRLFHTRAMPIWD